MHKVVVLGLKYFDWNADMLKAKAKAKEKAKEAEKASTSNQVNNTKPSHALTEYAGVYSNEALEKLKLFIKEIHYLLN